MTNRVYISQNSTYKEAVAKNYFSDRTLKVVELENGIAMPFGKEKGGIYDSKSLKLVATMDRENQKQDSRIKNHANLTKSDESVIFGGESYTDFGHLLLEGLSRLWYIIANPQDTRKIIFIADGEWGEKTLTKEQYLDFMKLLGVESDRVIIIEKPTQFRQITIPQVSYFAYSGYTKEYPQVYRRFAQGANNLCNGKQTFDKIYLSHAKWGHRPEQIFLNEQIYEDFFKNRGFEIIYPEEFSVIDIAYLMNNAKEIATTMGSTAHLGLFCKAGTRFIILTRECNTQPALIPQCLINQAMNLDWFIVNANHNYLPSFHQGTGWGVVNFAWTNDFKAFCADYFGDYFKSEFTQKCDEMEYFKAFAKFYSNPEYFERILSNLTPFDFVNKISEVFFGITLDKSLFVENNHIIKKKEKWHKRLWRHLKTMMF